MYATIIFLFFWALNIEKKSIDIPIQIRNHIRTRAELKQKNNKLLQMSYKSPIHRG